MRIDKPKQTPPFHFSLLASTANQRLDLVLAMVLTEYSRSIIQSWIKQGYVTIDNEPCQAKQLVKARQCVTIKAVLLKPKENWHAQEMPLSIIAQDPYLLVINKPAGLTVHPGAGQPDQTLVNALLHYDKRLEAIPRAGLLHRLDKQTSGLLLVARTLPTYYWMLKQMQRHLVKRTYDAFVIGKPICGDTIDYPIARHPIYRQRMAVIEDGKPAITHYQVIKHFRAHSHLNVTLETGRTHQIRTHMTYVGYPLIGDPVYPTRAYSVPKDLGDNLKVTIQHFKRQALHASNLHLIHPHTREAVHYYADLPHDLKQLEQALKADCLDAKKI